jgi:predicted glycosyltransferase
MNPPVIIFGVLNWGLGHATRSVPIIKQLQSEGYQVVIASDGLALDYLRSALPDAPFVELPPYKVTYGKKGMSLWDMTKQLPTLYQAIYQERKVLASIAAAWQPVCIFSDNRLGFRLAGVPSVYLTHQLRFEFPVFGKVLARLHHHFYKQFSEVWIPDLEGPNNLSGKLSQPIDSRQVYRHIGPKSRFSPALLTDAPRYDLMCILSGPEPQRTVLENIILEQAGEFNGSILVVRGTNNPLTTEREVNSQVTLKNLIQTDELLRDVQQSKLLLMRSGYSSIMDLVAMRRGAILIPTPGQIEQLYLGTRMNQFEGFRTVSQEILQLKSLPKTLEIDDKVPFFADLAVEKLPEIPNKKPG